MVKLIGSDCYSDPCLNGGTCMVGAGGIGYNCSCMNGYTGNMCQIGKYLDIVM